MAMRGRTHTPCAANVFGLHGNTYPCEAQCHWRHGCQQLLQSRRAPPTSATIIVATILWHCVCVCVLVRQQHVVLHPPPADTRAVQLCCSQKSTCRQPLLLLCFTSLLPCTATTMTTTFLFWSCCIQPLTHAVAFVAQGTRTHIKARWCFYHLRAVLTPQLHPISYPCAGRKPRRSKPSLPAPAPAPAPPPARPRRMPRRPYLNRC